MRDKIHHDYRLDEERVGGYPQVELAEGVVVGAGEKTGPVRRPFHPLQKVSVRVCSVPELLAEVVEPARGTVEPEHRPVVGQRRIILALFFCPYYLSLVWRRRRLLV